jgi:hypothetical protein
VRNSSKEVREEILGWAQESEDRLLSYLGQHISDAGPLGFSSIGFSDDATLAATAEKWIKDHCSDLVAAIESADLLDAIDAAQPIYGLVSSLFPEIPAAPLSLQLARTIVERRSRGVGEGGKASDLFRDLESENSVNYQTDNNNNGAEPPPLLMPSGKTPAKPGTQPDNTARGTADTPDGNSLRFTFEGALNRSSMANALNEIMNQRNLSVRKAAIAAGVGTQVIQRIASGDATIDKSLEVLRNLGCGFRVIIDADVAGNDLPEP